MLCMLYEDGKLNPKGTKKAAIRHRITAMVHFFTLQGTIQI